MTPPTTELQLQMQRMQFILDTIPIIITFWDTDFNMIDCNAEVLRLLGVPSKQDYMQNFFDYSPEVQPCGTPSRELVVQKINEAMQNGKVTHEWTHKHADGMLVPVEATSIISDYHGKPVIFTYALDKRQIKKSEARTKLMFESSPVIIEYWDKNGNCVDCNFSCYKFYGLSSKEEYLGKNFLDLVPESAREDNTVTTPDVWMQNLNIAFETGYAEFDFVAVKQGGIKYVFEVIAVRMEMENEPVVITYSLDITDRISTKIAEEHSRAKSRFLAHISHELRTPISAVLGVADIQLQNPALPPAIEEAFATIHNSASTLLDIINDLLDLSAVEAGKMKITTERYELASLINDVTQLHIVHLGSKKLDFKIHVDANLPTFLIGDPLKLKQILNNILSNAFKYTDKGNVDLYIQKREIPGVNNEEKILLSIIVKDTGRGMNQEQLNFLFDEYSRFMLKERRNIVGTGLGMSIVYNLVKLMDAEIDVQSELGAGTTVFLDIPQKPASDEKIGAETAAELEAFKKKPIQKKPDFVIESMPYGKVLIVDDVDANLYVAKGLLEFYKLEIETVTSGYSCLRRVEDGKIYDIIFMDQMMPDMDGIETTKILRKMGYDAPIVALTANALIGQAEEFLKNGFDGFLSKPIRTRHLNNLLNKFIRDKQPPEVLLQNKQDDGAQTRLDYENFLSSNLELLHKLLMDFTEGQRDAYLRITSALDAKDIKTAHRLAHTLKGLAALIHEMPLSKAAEEIEAMLKVGGIPPVSRLEHLNAQLGTVITKLEEMHVDNRDTRDAAPRPTLWSDEQVDILLERIHGLLVSRNAECLQWIDDLSKVSNTEKLVANIRSYDFRAALAALEELKASRLQVVSG